MDKHGQVNPDFITADRLMRIDHPSLWQVRAFLYHTVYLKELFKGDGYSYNAKGERLIKEYVMKNRPLNELGDYRLIDINRIGEIEAPSMFDPLLQTIPMIDK